MGCERPRKTSASYPSTSILQNAGVPQEVIAQGHLVSFTGIVTFKNAKQVQETARQIDAEVRSMVDEAYKSAYDILNNNHDIMHRMAAALLERETLDASDIKKIIAGDPLPPMRSISGPGSPTGDVQQVLKPDPGRVPSKGGERPATA